MSNLVGWDIGGAHLKAVLLDAKGEVVDSLQLPCPLWKGVDYLQRAILHALEALQIAPCDVNRISACHAITMTGELVDLFENRHQGVCEIAKTASDLLGDNVWFYAANEGFVSQHAVHRFTSFIASSNWHASASALSMHVPQALLVDIGSTTTDIIAIVDGKVAMNILSDAARLQNDTLVYTGVVRTPIMALAQKLVFEGAETNITAEFFATMSDVYRLTGELTTDDADTADGKGKTQLESARRLARMIGHDVDKSPENKEMVTWIKLAFACRSIQMQQIKTAMLKHLKPNMTIIGAGAGSFLVKQIANDSNDDLKHPFVHACDLVSMRSTGQSTIHPHLNTEHNIDVCFPAYAVALLAQKQCLC